MKTWSSGTQADLLIDAISARRVLRDVYIIQGDLKRTFENNEFQRTRIAWIASLAILRAVGHVLAKVDAKRSKWIKLSSDHEFTRLKQDRFANIIFWEFIEAERNLVLKEYKASIFDRAPDPLNESRNKTIVTSLLIGIEIYSPPDAVMAAIKWWECYLDRVEHGAIETRRSEKSYRKSLAKK